MMLLALYAVLFLFVALYSAEALLRIYRFRFLPLSYRLAYALFLLDKKSVDELYLFNQRVERSGLQTLERLLQHTAKISGRPLDEIKEKVLPKSVFYFFKNRSYYSGIFTNFDKTLKMHIGPVGKPNQKLSTLTINSSGFRATGVENQVDKNAKTIVFLGGSATFGSGATSDENTIPARLQYHLNKRSDSANKYKVLNYGMPSYNSLQELLTLMQLEEKPACIVALSGFNELAQAIFTGKSGVSYIAKQYEHLLERSPLTTLKQNFTSRFVLWFVVNRFVHALKAYDSHQAKTTKRFASEQQTADIYPLF